MIKRRNERIDIIRLLPWYYSELYPEYDLNGLPDFSEMTDKELWLTYKYVTNKKRDMNKERTLGAKVKSPYQFETFEQMLTAVDEGEYKPPLVYMSDSDVEVPFPLFQMKLHANQLRMMARGIKFRGIRLKDFQRYYDLSFRDCARCAKQLEEFYEIIRPYYENNLPQESDR